MSVGRVVVAAVGDDHPGPMALLELQSGLDRQLPHAGGVVLDVPVRASFDLDARRGWRNGSRRLPVDADALDVHAAQVEIEAVQVLGRDEDDLGHPLEVAR